jgi:hypothetical protein
MTEQTPKVRKREKSIGIVRKDGVLTDLPVSSRLLACCCTRCAAVTGLCMSTPVSQVVMYMELFIVTQRKLLRQVHIPTERHV